MGVQADIRNDNLDLLYSLDQDPDGYWVAYDLRLQLGWADQGLPNYYSTLIGNVHDSAVGANCYSNYFLISNSRSGSRDFNSSAGAKLGSFMGLYYKFRSYWDY